MSSTAAPVSLDAKPQSAEDSAKKTLSVMMQERKCEACGTTKALAKFTRNQLCKGTKARCRLCVGGGKPLPLSVKKTPQGWKRSRDDREQQEQEEVNVPVSEQPSTPVISRVAKRAKPEEEIPSEAKPERTDPFAFQQPERSSTCVVCLDKVPDILMIPCAHLATCSGCDSQSKSGECPICRAKIESRLKVFHV